MINNFVKSILNVIPKGKIVSTEELEKTGEKTIAEIFNEEKKENTEENKKEN